MVGLLLKFECNIGRIWVKYGFEVWERRTERVFSLVRTFRVKESFRTQK